MNALIEAIKARLENEHYNCSAPNYLNLNETWIRRIDRNDKNIEIRAIIKNEDSVECQIVCAPSAGPSEYFRQLNIIEKGVLCACLVQSVPIHEERVNIDLTVNTLFETISFLVDRILDTPNEKLPQFKRVVQALPCVYNNNPIRRKITIERVLSKWGINRTEERVDTKTPLNTPIKTRTPFGWFMYLDGISEDEAIRQLKLSCVKQLDEDLEKRQKAVEKQKKQLEQL